MDHLPDTARKALARSIWGSAAFTISIAVLLAAIIADHSGILTLPAAFRPYCGLQKNCDYRNLVNTALVMVLIGVGVHCAARLVRHLLKD